MTDPPRAAGRTLEHRALVVGVALFAVAVALYLPTLRHGFVEYDDVRVLLDHPQLYDERSLLGSLHQIFIGYFPREEPLLLRDVTWALDSRLYGFRNALGYHLGNVLWNGIDVALVFAFLLRATRRLGFAAVVAAAFAVAPVHVEPVAWVMGRKDVLSAAFALAALFCEAAASDDAARARRWRACGFVACVAAMLAKTSAITLVLGLAAWRVLAARVRSRGATGDARPARSIALDVALLWPHALASVAIWLWYARVLARFGLSDIGTVSAGRLLQMVRLLPVTFSYYLQSLFAFSDYSIIYEYPDSAIPLTAGEIAISLALVVAVVGFVVWTARKRRDLLFYALVFFALMIPYLHFAGVQRWRADRYIYLSSFCLFAIAVEIGGDLAARAQPLVRRVLFGAGAVWLALAMVVTLLNEPRFANDRALWSYEVALARPSLAAYDALASSLVAEARATHDAAARARIATEAADVANAGVAYYQRAPQRIADAPTREYALLYAQLGQAAALRGEALEKQLSLYETSYKIWPTDKNIVFLAQAMFRQAQLHGDLELARRSLHLYAQLFSHHASDASRRAVLARVLPLYRQAFPSLAPDVDALLRGVSP